MQSDLKGFRFFFGLVVGIVSAIVVWVMLSIWQPAWWLDWQSDVADNTLTEGVFYASPRERFVAELNHSPVGESELAEQWRNAWSLAQGKPVNVAFPYAEKGQFKAEDPAAFAYQFALQAGQHLSLVLSNPKLFVSVYRQQRENDQLQWEMVTLQVDEPANPSNGLLRRFSAKQDGDFLLVLQAPLLKNIDYTLKLELVSELEFPVSGRDTSAIQSFFGAPRDGGRRSHRGVDIFAPRGTPLLAAVDGVVTSTRGNALGGKVVWLRSLSQGRTYYYAHMDTVDVSAGELVSAGDRLGTVGNSGNARSTPPHLHFSIYQRGTALDPLPYLQAKRVSPEVWQAVQQTAPWPTVAATITGLNFRQGPDTDFAVIRTLSANEELHVLAASDQWLRIATQHGEIGFVSQRYVRKLSLDERVNQAVNQSQRHVVAVESTAM